MNRSLKQKLAAAAAVAVVLLGGAVVAVTATGQGTTYNPEAARRSAHHSVRRDLAAAASYLGISTAQLQGDLQSGQTLAQVAGATSGKSAAGLIEALVAEKKQRLAAAAATLAKRVTAEVNRSGGPGSPSAGPGSLFRDGAARRGGGQRLFAAPTRLGFVAASYLGVSTAQLQSDVQSGQTLAQVANATSGKSAAGLIDALVGARRARLDAAVASGGLAAAKASAIESKLTRRMTVLVNRKLTRAKRAQRKG